jgi:two-component system C4-dicarboxylate transport response regulator DctD
MAALSEVRAGEHDAGFGEIVGRSQIMRQLFVKIRRAAAVDVDVLLVGETGTGKELVARAIHANSVRQNQQIAPENCGALQTSLAGSELFGHEPGAFTDARSRRIGLFEHASPGTVFLDEINLLPMSAQGTLLRVLEERKVRRLGGNKDISIDVRIIAASSVDLVGREDFRAELYHRLNQVRIRLPSLAERRDDIPLLAEHFCAHYAGEMSLDQRWFRLWLIAPGWAMSATSNTRSAAPWRWGITACSG